MKKWIAMFLVFAATQAKAEPITERLVNEADIAMNALHEIVKSGDYKEIDAQYAEDVIERFSPLQYSYYPKTARFFGQIYHYANLVSAGAMLKKNNIQGASRYLIQACEKDGFVMSSFGPNMSVALGLLKIGQKEPVIAYLQQCRRFWFDRKAYEWEEEIRNGKIPDFGANLDY